MERLLYRMAALDTSVTMDTQLRMAPEIMPLDIMGTVTLKKVFILEAPRLMDASSTDSGIWMRVAVADRVV